MERSRNSNASNNKFTLYDSVAIKKLAVLATVQSLVSSVLFTGKSK